MRAGPWEGKGSLRCLVTGCAGFIGSHLSEALVRRGDTVRGVDCFTNYYSKKTKLSNLSGLLNNSRFEFVEADLASSNLARLVDRVDAVLHLAAQPGVRASWGKTFSYYVRDNIVATQRLLEALKGHEVKSMVYASSSSIYGDAERLPTAEDARPQPVSPYGATKLAAEHLCNVYFRNFQIPVVSLRYFTVYGPRQRPDMAFSRFISNISAGREIEVYGDGEQRRDFTYVDDTVKATILALGGKHGTTYNVGAGRSISLKEVISQIELLTGKSARIKWRQAALGDVRDTSADIRKIQSELGYSARTQLARGLRMQVESQLLRADLGSRLPRTRPRTSRR